MESKRKLTDDELGEIEGLVNKVISGQVKEKEHWFRAVNQSLYKLSNFR